MQGTTEKVVKLVGDAEKDFQKEENFKELVEASEKYNEMVQGGVIQRKGYGLLSIDQVRTNCVKFNAQGSCWC